MLGNDIRRLGAVNLNLVTMSMAWPSCPSSTSPARHHHQHLMYGGLVWLWAGSGGEALLHHHVAQESGRDRWSAWGRNVTKAAVVITPSPSTQQERPPPLSSTPLAPLVRIVREIAGRLHEEVKVNLWIGKYSGQKPESMAWKLKEIVVAETIFVVIFKNVKGAWCHWLI